MQEPLRFQRVGEIMLIEDKFIVITSYCQMNGSNIGFVLNEDEIARIVESEDEFSKPGAYLCSVFDDDGEEDQAA